jgi:selenocysteine lyase/cysteine desulfurase
VNFDQARAQFPVLDRFAYLNAGSMGPLGRPTVEAMAARQRRDLEQGRSGSPYIDEIHALRQRVRSGIAATIGVPAENLALTNSTTEGCNIVLAGLRLGLDDEVVTTDTEHFGLLGPLRASGARIRVARIRQKPAELALETILAELSPKTRLLALSHVSWQTGNLLPVEELRDATELPMLVDGAQSAGAIAVDAARFDYYTVSGHKWLCGPDATGGLYVRDPEALHVALPTYFSQDEHDETGDYRPKAGAARFDGGWIPTASLAGLEAALAAMPHWAAHHATEIAARCWAGLSEHFEVVTAPGQATLVSFVPERDEGEEVVRLLDHGVVLRDMPGTGWLRASCGWWTSDADLDRLLGALRG